MGQQPSTPLLGALCWCRDGIEPAARPVSCAMSRRPGLGRLRRRRLPRPPSGPFFWPARYFFCGSFVLPGRSGRRARLVKDPLSVPRSPAKKGKRACSLRLRISRPPSRPMLAEKERARFLHSRKRQPGGGRKPFSGRYPSSSEPWAGTLGPRRASPGLARRRPIDRDRGFRSRERTAEVLHLFGATGRA